MLRKSSPINIKGISQIIFGTINKQSECVLGNKGNNNVGSKVNNNVGSKVNNNVGSKVNK